MKRIFLIVALLSLTLIACDKSNIVYGIVENAEGITDKSNVKFNGLVIGSVQDIDLKGNKIYATIKLKENVSIPKYSFFSTVSADLFGNKEIEVIYDSIRKNEYLQTGDTIFISKDNVRYSDHFKFLKDSTLTPEQKLDSVKKTVIHIITNDAN